jgi:AraC-like DNA-binding protein
MPLLTFDQIASLAVLRQFYHLAWHMFSVNIALVAPDRHRSLYIGAPETWLPFCLKLTRQMGGEVYCQECDQRHLAMVKAQPRVLRYECWAGLREFIVPIVLEGEIQAFIQCGQVLDAAPGADEWARTRQALEARGIPAAPLEELYFAARVIPDQTQQDLMALLELFSNYIAYAQHQILLAEASQQSRVVERALSFIRQRSDEPLSLDEVARAACTSKRNLTRVFQARTGMTVLQSIQEMRIERACRLLQAGEMTCAQVAFECGFGSVQQFNRVFRQLRGCAPQAWQRRAFTSSGRPERP